MKQWQWLSTSGAPGHMQSVGMAPAIAKHCQRYAQPRTIGISFKQQLITAGPAQLDCSHWTTTSITGLAQKAHHALLQRVHAPALLTVTEPHPHHSTHSMHHTIQIAGLTGRATCSAPAAGHVPLRRAPHTLATRQQTLHHWQCRNRCRHGGSLCTCRAAACAHKLCG